MKPSNLPDRHRVTFIGGHPDFGYFFHHKEGNLFGSLSVKRAKNFTPSSQEQGFLWLWLISHVSEVNPENDNWISSRAISPVMLVSYSSEQDFHEMDINILCQNFDKMTFLYEGSGFGLPAQSIRQIPEQTRIEHWKFFNRQTKDIYHDWLEKIGANRKTTIDYLNLQRLGCINYVKQIAEEDQESERAVRARVAYARRQGWIDKAGHGIRSSQLTKLINEKDNQQRT
jgi:hypothetical protein